MSERVRLRLWGASWVIRVLQVVLLASLAFLWLRNGFSARSALAALISAVGLFLPALSARRTPTSDVVRPPLGRLNALLGFVYTTNTYNRVFRPIIADIVMEWQDAEVRNDRRRSFYLRWILGPCCVFWHAVVLPLDLTLGRILALVRGNPEKSKPD
jgi:hypothetical protein